MEKKFLAAGLVLTSLFVIAYSSNIAQQKQAEKPAIVQSIDTAAADKKLTGPANVIDTIPGEDAEKKEISNETIYSVNGKEYKIVTQNGHVDELYVNGQRIPEEKMEAYKPEIDKIIVQSKIDRRHAEEDMAKSQKEMEESKIRQAASEKEMVAAKLKMEQSGKKMERDMEQSKMQLEKSKLEMEQSQKDMALYNEKAKKEMEEAQKDMALYKEKAKKEMEQSQKDMTLYGEKARKEMEQAQKDMALSKKQAQIQMEKSKLEMEQSAKRMEQSQKDMENARVMQDNITGDLIKENIIKDKKDLSSYKLNDEELIVNGARQPDAVHKKFKEKYVKGKGWTIQYHNDAN